MKQPIKNVLQCRTGPKECSLNKKNTIKSFAAEQKLNKIYKMYLFRKGALHTQCLNISFYLRKIMFDFNIYIYLQL